MTAAIRTINALERRIVKAEDEADAMLWEQARQVVELLNTMSTRDIAKQWRNVKGDPYSAMHVSLTARTWTVKLLYNRVRASAMPITRSRTPARRGNQNNRCDSTG